MAASTQRRMANQGLQDLYDWLGGENWRNSDGWLDPGSDVREWYGLTITSAGDLVSINLISNDLEVRWCVLHVEQYYLVWCGGDACTSKACSLGRGAAAAAAVCNVGWLVFTIYDMKPTKLSLCTRISIIQKSIIDGPSSLRFFDIFFWFHACLKPRLARGKRQEPSTTPQARPPRQQHLRLDWT